MALEFTLKDPKDTYLSILQVGGATDNEALHVTTLKVIHDAAGYASLLELSQSKIGFTGIMEADSAAGMIMDPGVPFTSEEVIVDSLLDKTDNNVGIFFTTGDPEGSLTGGIGSLALRKDGSSGTTLHVKESGVGNTGWVPVDLVGAFTDLSDVPGVIAADQWLKGNAGGTALEFTAAPASTLLELDDTPGAYDSGKFLKSDAGEFVLEDIPIPSFLDLTDVTEPNYTNDKHALIAVNLAENGLEFAAAAPTHGDIIFFNGTSWTKLPADTAGKVLITQGPGADPEWDVASAGGSNDPDAVHVDVAGEINGVALKAVPAAGDVVIVEDVADSFNKKKVTVGTLLGNDANAIHDNISGEIVAITEKTTPHDDDVVIIEDSEASDAKKSVKLSNLGGGGGTAIPHYSQGSGEFHMNVVAPTVVLLQAQSAVKVSAFDLIKALQGGAASPTYTFFVSKTTSFGAGNSDPTAEYVTFGHGDVGTQFIYVKASDGTTTTYHAQIFVTVQEEPGGP